MHFRPALLVVVAVAALSVACGGSAGTSSSGGATPAATSGSGSSSAAATATPKSAFATATSAPGKAPTTSPTPIPTNIESKGFVSKCDAGANRWYGGYAKVPNNGYVSGGALEVLLQTANGTELQRVAANLASAGTTQGYIVSKSWTPANIGGELSQVKIGVTQAPADAQLPEIARTNPFEFKVTDIVITATGPQLAISTENKGEINVGYNATGFIVNPAGEVVSAFTGQGTTVAKAPPTVSRIMGTFNCPGVTGTLTAYVQVAIMQQAGSQNVTRTEIQSFTK